MSMITPFIDVILIMMMALTMLYCIKLNVVINRFRSEKKQFEKVIADFVAATAKAEQTIPELKETSERISESLEKKIDKAHLVADDLMFMIDRSKKLSTKIDNFQQAIDSNKVQVSNEPMTRHFPASVKNIDDDKPLNNGRRASLRTNLKSENENSKDAVKDMLDRINRRDEEISSVGITKTI